MQTDKKLDFLLGATSPGGFSGYFTELQKKTDGWRLLLLKGGPGCGKSTLMMKIADHLVALGDTVELIHCSSDPDSLDGVISPTRKFSIVDATAPHNVEPSFPVAFEEIISLYPFMDREKLHFQQADIIALSLQCNLYHERAARYITAAASLINDSMRATNCAADLNKARVYGERLSLKHLPRKDETGSEEVRLLSAMTLQGSLCYTDTVPKLAEDILILHDEYGAVAKVVLKAVRESALRKGYHVISCYCPLSPYEKLEHLIIPDANFAIVTSNHFHSFSYPGNRIVHCERFCDKSSLSFRRKRLKFNRKAAEELILQASILQQEAKVAHDKLELIYKQAVNFDGISLLTETIISSLS